MTRNYSRGSGVALVVTLLVAMAHPAGAADREEAPRTDGDVEVLAAPPTPTPTPTRTVHTVGNPILADGSLYTADSAPLVGGDGRLYIYAGHDEADPQTAGFAMYDYNVLATDDPASGQWDVYEENLVVADVFDWATGSNAYAGQATMGANGKYYWYLPVQSKDTGSPNAMAIGVAVSDSPVGPWMDAIGEPLVDWRDVYGDSREGNEIIDPHVFTDDDGKVYLYWGSWGTARAVELASDMVTTIGTHRVQTGLDGFYEAPWVVKRNGVYHMLYDWKVGGSACTPSNYQACIAWATSTSPWGPWTYRGLVLDAPSATTVHPSLIEHDGDWWMTYHTKDAVDGGHFRRSVAIDQATWDGDTLLKVNRTRADDPAYRLTDNVALAATPATSFTESPPMRLTSVNDGFRATTVLLPPDLWGNYRGTTSTVDSDWLSYRWDTPARIDGAGLQFHQDANWIRSPESWRLDYLDHDGDWTPVEGASYPTTPGEWHRVSFAPVTTSALRATFVGQPEGAYVHSVAVPEFEVYGVEATTDLSVDITTRPGIAPTLPEAVRADVGGEPVWSPVAWRPLDSAAYAESGSFTVEGRALGVTASYVTATVTVSPDSVSAQPPADDTAPDVSIATLGADARSGWHNSAVTARVRSEDDIDYRSLIETRTDGGPWVAIADARFANVVVSGSGTHTIEGRATDAAGNTSPPVTRTLRIDADDPVADGRLAEATRTTTVTASDTLSGIGKSWYRFDSASDTGTWRPLTLGEPVSAPGPLPSTLVYRVTDVAGNDVTGSVDVPLAEGTHLTGNVAPYAHATASNSSGWAPPAGLNDGSGAVEGTDSGKLGRGWGTWPLVGEQWARYDWQFDVTVDQVGIWWDWDSPDSSNAGLIPPRSWELQYETSDGGWVPVEPKSDQIYARDRDRFNTLVFEPVRTRALRVLVQSWGAAETQGSTGVREWQVIAAAEQSEPVKVTSGEVNVRGTPRVGATLRATTSGWGPDDVQLRYQWLADGQPIARATEPAIALTPALLGRRLSMRVTGTITGSEPVSRSSMASVPIARGQFTETPRPVVRGTRKVGRTVRAVARGWVPAPSNLRYQWKVDGRALRGATRPTLTLTERIQDHRVTVVVTAVRPGYTTVSRTSKALVVRHS